MILDYDAHRRILAWAVSSGRMKTHEYNCLISSVTRAEGVATACAGKEAFRDATMARRIAERSAGRNSHGMVPYKCFKCRLWHIGTKIPKAAQIRHHESRRMDDE